MIKHIQKILNFDDYDMDAMFIPAVINLTAVFYFGGIFLMNNSALIKADAVWKIVSVIASSPLISLVFARFLVDFFRGSSKILESVLYGKDRTRFPSTSMLLLKDNSISRTLKSKIRGYLADRGFKLLSKAKEVSNEKEARLAARDAVGFIRKCVDEQDDTIYQRKLVRYGCHRNFLGGFMYCFPICVVLFAFNILNDDTYKNINIVVLVTYTVIGIIRFFLLKRSAIEYAECLFTSFDKIKN